MDELLALMEDDPPEEKDEETIAPQSGMDELASLIMDDNPSEDLPSSSRPPSYSRHSTMVSPATNSKKRHSSSSSNHRSSSSSSRQREQQQPLPANKSNIGVDDQLGIRMLNRQVSSLDLMEWITDHPYKSPAALSAMSLQVLTRILVDPPRLVDRATVCGKTDVMTVGIVFTNSGTRISAKGGAFCVLTIGNFVSGPCLVILLFGDAYSKYCRSCVQGKVIALINPKLLPPKNDDSSVSFSVHDVTQLRLLATSRDYGMCTATVRAKQQDGSWAGNGGQCKNYIDKRQCNFCETHRKQKYKASSSTTSINNRQVADGGATWIQKMRSEVAPVQPTSSGNQMRQTGNLLVNNSASWNNDSSSNNNRLLNATSATIHGRQVPMHMKKKPLAARTKGNAALPPRNNNKGAGGNRLLNGSIKPMAERKAQKRGIVGPGDWLQQGISKKKTPLSSLAQQNQKAAKKRRSINTMGTGGFDGSVAVPKPSRMFQSQTPKLLATTTTSSALSNQDPGRGERIRQRQSLMAQQLKEQAVAPQSKGAGSKSKSKNGNRGQVQSSSGSFLDSIQVDTEKVVNAKSRFASEADAEQYARNRLRLTELEKQESSKQSKAKPNADKKLMIEWSCATCGGTFDRKPVSCIAAKHQVQRKRSLAKSRTKTDERTKLNERNSSDGGLVLGSGLDWSRTWSRFS